MRNVMLVPHMSREIIRSFNPVGSNTRAPFNWTVHTVIEVHCPVVFVECLFRLEGSGPRAIWCLAGKSARGTSVRATVEIIGTC